MTKRKFRVTAVGVYVIVIAAVIFGLARSRQWAQSAFRDGQAQVEWDTFRDEMAQQRETGTAPVQRRVPKSVEPPALVLMRTILASAPPSRSYLRVPFFWPLHSLWVASLFAPNRTSPPSPSFHCPPGEGGLVRAEGRMKSRLRGPRFT